MTRNLVLALAALVILAACSDTTSPPIDEAGLRGATYDLVTMMGYPVGFVFESQDYYGCSPSEDERWDDAASDIRYDEGVLGFVSAGAFTLTLTARTRCRLQDGTTSEWRVVTSVLPGTYTLDGTTIELDRPVLPYNTGTLLDNRARIVIMVTGIDHVYEEYVRR